MITTWEVSIKIDGMWVSFGDYYARTAEDAIANCKSDHGYLGHDFKAVRKN